MKICQTIQERNAVEDAILTVTQADGTFVVYQAGDEIPADLLVVTGMTVEAVPDGN